LMWFGSLNLSKDLAFASSLLNFLPIHCS
jgi:hypothetical protein